MGERLQTQRPMPKADGRILVESVRSLEHGQRTLQLIAQHVAMKRDLPGALEADWPARKKWLSRLCERALRIPSCKPLVLDVFANQEAFGLSTYFAAEMVETLAAAGAETPLLVRLVELFRARRPAGDKGSAAGYHRLLKVLRERKEEDAAKAASSGLRKLLDEAKGPQPAAAAAAAAAEGQVPAEAPAAPATA
ncbi:hypothetical protein HYH03_013993 [Edaphochlamys debaryana]|uniref:Uncharacterized protein n=1 Tax=Edaphochlamys debaryana TaxID=47281 RepID=A0A835XP15_9CHLO|nr:hypothetical protein HYH03_013993 [Edaphochlamys debaryana]|eukprot:KAG2487426.1 hypothetical protein HYH03_013993 [Edaphochlamys debaryana]